MLPPPLLSLRLGLGPRLGDALMCVWGGWLARTLTTTQSCLPLPLLLPLLLALLLALALVGQGLIWAWGSLAASVARF